MKKNVGPINFVSESEVFNADLALYEALRASDTMQDKITLLLMEPHGESDATGLWYEFAQAKAKLIVEMLNETYSKA